MVAVLPTIPTVLTIVVVLVWLLVLALFSVSPLFEVSVSDPYKRRDTLYLLPL